jgi:hypothetical protein
MRYRTLKWPDSSLIVRLRADPHACALANERCKRPPRRSGPTPSPRTAGSGRGATDGATQVLAAAADGALVSWTLDGAYDFDAPT